MKIIKILSSLLVVAVMFGCASTNTNIIQVKSQDNELVGYWYGEGKDGSRIVKFVNHRKADGTYKILFKWYSGSTFESHQIERGVWTLDNGYYSTNTRSITSEEGSLDIDPADEYFKDKYKIINLTDQIFEYVHLKTDTKYKARRVFENFEY